MRDPVRHFVAEFIGIFALVFVGGATVMATANAAPGVGLLAVALANGLTLAAMVTAFMRVSGHFNPAVTIGFLVTRRIEPMMGALYVVAQLVGAIAGAYALKATFPPVAFTATNGGWGLGVNELVTSGQAFLIEIIATFFLMTAYMATGDARRARVGGLAIGATATALHLAFFPVTGAAFNPARAFGPAVATQMWAAQGIYWGGPIIGAVLAAVVYNLLFARGDAEPADHGELAR